MQPIPPHPQLPPAHAGVGGPTDARKILGDTHRYLGIVLRGWRFVAVALLVAFVADLLDARVRTVSEIRKLIDLPVIGLIPQLNAEAQGLSVGLLSHETPRSQLAESYKSTRTNLEFLRRNRRAEAIEEIRPRYDTVIIDSSPLLAVTDPSIIAAMADGVILVVRVSSTRRHDIDRTTELLRTLGVPVLGMVVNGVTRQQMGYGYGYGYGGYGYGYGHSYGQNNAVANGNGVNGSAPKDVSPPAVSKGRLGHDGDPSTA